MTFTVISCCSPLQKGYAPGSVERKALEATLAQMEQELPFEVPCIVNGKEVGVMALRFKIISDSTSRRSKRVS